MKNKFIAFLKKNRAYNRFIKDYNTDGNPYPFDVNEYINKYSDEPYYLIIMAFVWVKVSRKYKFWDRINEKWLKELQTIQNEKP